MFPGGCCCLSGCTSISDLMCWSCRAPMTRKLFQRGWRSCSSCLIRTCVRYIFQNTFVLQKKVICSYWIPCNIFNIHCCEDKSALETYGTKFDRHDFYYSCYLGPIKNFYSIIKTFYWSNPALASKQFQGTCLPDTRTKSISSHDLFFLLFVWYIYKYGSKWHISINNKRVKRWIEKKWYGFRSPHFLVRKWVKFKKGSHEFLLFLLKFWKGKGMENNQLVDSRTFTRNRRDSIRLVQLLEFVFHPPHAGADPLRVSWGHVPLLISIFFVRLYLRVFQLALYKPQLINGKLSYHPLARASPMRVNSIEEVLDLGS